MKRQTLPLKQVPVVVAFVVGITIGLTASPLLRQPPEPILQGGTPKLTWEVYFSPRERGEPGPTDAIVRELKGAKTTVLVQAYSFTSKRIAQALVDAHKRGVQVQVILDQERVTETYAEADFLVDMAISTYIDDKERIAHNKVIIIDGETVITGSFNFTKAAEEDNAENLLVIRDKELAALYEKNWHKHRAHSQPYTGRGKP